VARAASQTAEQRQNYIAGLLYAFVDNGYRAALDGNRDDYHEYLKRADELYAAYRKRTGANQRLDIPTVAEMERIVRDRLLSPEGGLSPEEIARLRTLVNMPAETPAPPKPP
jgi:hypothetical protein